MVKGTMAGREERDARRHVGVWLRRWLVLLNVGALAAAVFLTLFVARRALILVALAPIVLVPFAYARLRLQRALDAWLVQRGGAVAIALAGVMLDAFMMAQLLTARSSSAADWLQGPVVGWVGPVWFSGHALLFVGYALLGLARLLSRPFGRALRMARERLRPVDEKPASQERREFLQQVGALGAGLPFFVSVSNIPLSYDFRVEPREIELPHWPAALDGLRVAHLSDIHVGGEMNRARLLRVAELTNAQRPDLVLHTGDFLTHRGGAFDEPLYEALALISVPYGQWACLGNHDFDDPDLLSRRLADCGVTTLRDRLVTLSIDGQPLEIAGLDYRFWRAQGAATYTRVFGEWGPRGHAPRILLNHDPSAFPVLPEDGADLVLSGHTHGGHIGVQLDSARAVTVVGLAGIPDQGIFRRSDLCMYVTRCVGFYGYPMRLGIPPEIAILTLRTPRSRQEA